MKYFEETGECRLERWQTLMSDLKFTENTPTYYKLINAYNEPHRRYHTCTHISATLRHLDSVAHLIIDKALVELALWFHDAVYQPFSSSNELDSAQWASQFLRENKASQDVVDTVFDLIMATVHSSSKPATREHAFLVDIDLSILGVEPHIYQQFEKDIRYEYKRVPYFLYRKKRKEVLQSFVCRSAIYQTSFFADTLEVQARRNIESAMNAL